MVEAKVMNWRMEDTSGRMKPWVNADTSVLEQIILKKIGDNGGDLYD